MKKLITIGYVLALLASGVGFAKADTMTVSVSAPTVNSVMMCNMAKTMFSEGVTTNELYELLEASKLDNEDKMTILNCFLEEIKKS